MELSKLLEEVRDADSFLVFVRALASDCAHSTNAEIVNPSLKYGPATDGWENTTILSFLNGAVGWAEDSNFGLTQGLQRSNPWRQFATFLYCGKIYE